MTTLDDASEAHRTRVIHHAYETFGNPEKAARWLCRPNAVLRNRRPLDMLSTEDGAREVERLLGQIDHGIIR